MAILNFNSSSSGVNTFLTSSYVTTLNATDSLTGSAFNDTLSGYAGNDSLLGGAGNDVIFGDATVFGSSTVGLNGSGGNDTINGGTGNDMMYGGAGNDVYYVDSGFDFVSEGVSTVTGSADAGGTDIVYSSVSWTLGNYLENLTLLDGSNINGTGNVLNNVLTGNTGNNSLSGGAGNDTIYGEAGNDTLDGGSGNDTMYGGAGNDRYVIDNLSDVVSEGVSTVAGAADAGGTDTVVSSVNWTLGSYFENLTLAAGVAAALTATGNELNNVLAGNGNANTLNGGAGNDTMEGGAGNDTYVVDSALDVVSEATVLGGTGNAGGTDTVQSSVSWTLGSFFENLTLLGSANLSATGNAVSNLLLGNGGDNTLDGGLGNDTMYGGAGNDLYVVDSTSDVVSEAVSAVNTADAGGNDTVSASISYTLGNYLENLTLAGAGNINGTGNALNNSLTGNTGNNSLSGGLGNDTIDGGLGNDTMVGDAGDDSYTVDSSLDVVSEATVLNGSIDAGGFDRVFASVSYTLGSFIERLTLTGSAAISGTGNALNNLLIGNAGDNALNGGAGNDTMYGGAGNDTYTVDSLYDVVNEDISSTDAGDAGGIDTVVSSLSWVLGDRFENLVLTGSANLTGSGNEADNVITGNSGANLLWGGAGNDTIDGGTGMDTVYGGSGDDVYHVNLKEDVVSEQVSASDKRDAGGIDLVIAATDYTLGAYLENLTLNGTGATSATGNGLRNILIGNSGDNWLDGGAGADTMRGGGGNDGYVVDNAGDVVSEAVSATNPADAGGTDFVMSSVSWTLGNFVENLYLSGAKAISGTGNALANVIWGNVAANTLNGGAGNDTLIGGFGNDTLTGGTGADCFKFSNLVFAAGLNGVDLIKDFDAAQDLIVVDAAFVPGLETAGAGALAAAAFASGAGLTQAQTASTRFIYDTTAGALYFDGDGSGTDFAAVKFAVLGTATHPALTSASIHLA